MNAPVPLAFVDAHHHLWDLRACHYPWLMARGVRRFFGDPTPIQKNYLPRDFLSESARYRPVKSVHIQVGVEEKQSVDETRWLATQANTGPGFPHGIVAFADLSADDAAAQLDDHLAATDIRGVRQIVGRHVDEDSRTGTGSLLANPAWRRGLGELADRGLSFDLQLVPPQLDDAYRVFSTVPDLPVALCHCGSPWDRSPEGLDAWRAGLKRLATLPRFYCKVSGLGMFDPDWTVRTLRPIVTDVIEIFGPDRCLFGSNFPVDKLYRSYTELWSAYEAIAADYSADEQTAMFRTNAERFYRL